WVDVHGPDIPRSAFPEPACVIGRIQNRFGMDGRIEGQHRFQQFTIAALPNTAERDVLRGRYSPRLAGGRTSGKPGAICLLIRLVVHGSTLRDYDSEA